MTSIGGYYSSRDSDLNYLEENTSKIIDLKKAQMKIKEMEDCLKSMNEENDNLKGKLGNVISHLTTPQAQEGNKLDKKFTKSYEEKLKQKARKQKNFSSIINNNTLEDLKSKFKISSNANNAKLLTHQKSNSLYPKESEEYESNLPSSDEAANENANNSNYNYNKNDAQEVNAKNTKEIAPALLRWNRNMTLGKNSQNNFIHKQDVSPNNKDCNKILSDNQNPYKINSFNVNDNTSSFTHYDYENINDKISNLDNIENMDNTNNLEEIEQMENEDEDQEEQEEEDNYNLVEFPLQLKLKNKKKFNKI